MRKLRLVVLLLHGRVPLVRRHNARLVGVVVQQEVSQEGERLKALGARLLARERGERAGERWLQPRRDVGFGRVGRGQRLQQHGGEEELDLAQRTGGRVRAVRGVLGPVAAVQRAQAAGRCAGVGAGVGAG